MKKIRTVKSTQALPPRAAEVVEILYRRGKSAARDVQDALTGEPSYSAVRSVLRGLKDRNLVQCARVGRQNMYSITQSRQTTRRREVRRLVDTFFEGSVTRAVAALVKTLGQRLSQQDIDEMAKLIEKVRREGR